MIDRSSISFEFGDSGIYVTQKELELLPESVETLYDELISQAKEVSPYYAKCLQDFLDVSENSVRAFFSESTRQRIYNFCKKEQDDDFLKLYESLFQYVRKEHQISVDVKYVNAEKLIFVFGEHFPPEDILELQRMSKSIGHFPLFLAFDKFFRNCDPFVRDYALFTSYIYHSSTKKDRERIDLDGDEAKAFYKLNYKIGRLSRHIERLFKDVGNVYKNRQYQEINEIEKTCFSKSFIYWILYKYAGAWFLGSYNSRFPGWCFSSESVEICFPPRNLPKDPFENLYNYIAEHLATFRENDIKVSVPELLQYKDPPDDAKIVYNPITGERTIEEVPGTIIKVNPSRSVMDEVKRLVRFIGNDLIIKGHVLIIPAGSVVLIPQEKQESVSPVERMRMLINEWAEGRRQKDEERKMRAKTIVDSCPLVDRFIEWAKSQDWYELWSFLIKKFYELEAEEYLHSDFVFRILNNSRPEGYSSNVLFPWEKDEEEMSYEVRDFLSSLQPDVKNYIYEDRKRVVREIENEIESNQKGYLIKRTEEIFERFGLDAKRLEDGFKVLHNSLQSRRIEFAPYNFKKHICLWRSKAGIIDWSLIWRWKERYEAQYSFIRIAAQMVRPTCLEEIDMSFIQKFLTIQIMDAKAKLYFLYCFVIFSIDGPEIRSYNFSNLSKEQKSEYYILLEEFARNDIKRVAVLEKYKHKFLTS